MKRFTKEDENLLFVIKELEAGTWADTTKAYNQLAKVKRTEDGLKAKHKLMKTSRRSKSIEKRLERSKGSDGLRSRVKQILEHHVGRASLVVRKETVDR
jgi:alpha-ketoglutarate-dependent taurine dioxygenase